ncbi:unnamed protein product [Bursaphelenchus xylophilus]|uniref:Glycoprotein-N-acetylgalactosamine 3-beta-galactosyltransferase 1 n=1 Tax=Bursaphelenchus xylophilus TaxID=6326 RepID=A0A1I7RNG4_BURXY|nr:unnamed protein product [Bursaphelenchus xylophilus]CAG9123987.1 unnamed protein product [Bursaphelenchus xylophilus]
MFCCKRQPVILYLLGVLTGILLFSLLQFQVHDQTYGHNTDDFVPQAPPLSGNSTEENTYFFYKHEHGESAVVKELKKRVRILCWIMTHNSKNGNMRATAVNRTWGPKCDKYLFVSTNVSSLPSVDLNVTEGRKYLWQKTKRAFKYVYDHYGSEYDWFVKADDDTFMFVENLRFMLMNYNKEEPIYFGCNFKVIVRTGYMSGGAGYILSHEALRRFVEDGLSDPKKCKAADTGDEDVEVGRCLGKLGVILGDSRDASGRHRMLPMAPEIHFGSENKGKIPDWFENYTRYPIYNEKGECCSDYMISFHYVSGAKMYALYNLVYHVRVFGVTDEHLLLGAPNLGQKLTKISKESNRELGSRRKK